MYLRRIIIIYNYYTQSASYIRMVAMAKGYAKAGKEVIFIIKASKMPNVPDIEGITTIVIDDKISALNIIKKIDVIKQLKKSVDKYYDNSSAIHIYGISYLNLLFTKRNYRCFYEITEVPFYSDAKESLLYYIQELIKTPIAKLATGLFVISSHLKDYFIERGIENVYVLNMFVDPSRFANSITHPDNIISYCGSVSVYKDGVDFLIKAFDIVRRQHPDYKLVIIGDYYDDKTKTIVSDLLTEFHLSNSVIITGKILAQDVPEKLYESQILALARPDNKQAYYGFPTKVGEYLSTGRPVVITDVGCICEFLKDGESALICKPGDINEFAEKMIWAISHQKEAAGIGERGFLQAQEHFSNEKEAIKAINIIEAIG